MKNKVMIYLLLCLVIASCTKSTSSSPSSSAKYNIAYWIQTTQADSNTSFSIVYSKGYNSFDSVTISGYRAWQKNIGVNDIPFTCSLTIRQITPVALNPLGFYYYGIIVNKDSVVDYPGNRQSDVWYNIHP